MRRVDKPWGYELIWAHTDRYVGKVLHINAGQSLSRQYHRQKDETFLVQTGTLQLEIGPTEDRRVLMLQPGESFHCTPGTIHRMVAASDVDIVEVSTPELDDVVRLEDAYGREGTSAPLARGKGEHPSLEPRRTAQKMPLWGGTDDEGAADAASAAACLSALIWRATES